MISDKRLLLCKMLVNVFYLNSVMPIQFFNRIFMNLSEKILSIFKILSAYLASILNNLGLKNSIDLQSPKRPIK